MRTAFDAYSLMLNFHILCIFTTIYENSSFEFSTVTARYHCASRHNDLLRSLINPYLPFSPKVKKSAWNYLEMWHFWCYEVAMWASIRGRALIRGTQLTPSGKTTHLCVPLGFATSKGGHLTPDTSPSHSTALRHGLKSALKIWTEACKDVKDRLVAGWSPSWKGRATWGAEKGKLRDLHPPAPGMKRAGVPAGGSGSEGCLAFWWEKIVQKEGELLCSEGLEGDKSTARTATTQPGVGLQCWWCRHGSPPHPARENPLRSSQHSLGYYNFIFHTGQHFRNQFKNCLYITTLWNPSRRCEV